MLDIVIFAVRVFVCVAEVIMVFMLFNAFYERKYDFKWYLAAGAGLMLALWVCGYIALWYVNLTTLTVAMILIAFLMYEGSPLTKTINILLYLLVLMSCESFVYSIGNSFELMTPMDARVNDPQTVPMAIVAKLLQFAVCTVLLRFGRQQDNKLLPKDFIALIFTSVISIAASFVIFFQNVFDDAARLTANILASLGLLLFNFVMYYLFTRSKRLAITEQEKEFLEQRSEFEKEKFIELENIQHKVEILYHDMKNHLNVATRLMDSGSDSARAYLQEVREEITQYSPVMFGGSSVVDAVLYSKTVKARERGIPLDISLNMDTDPPVDKMDLCSIFSNALDNAIEAQTGCNGEKYIKLTAVQKASFLKIKVENPYEGTIHKDRHGELITRKKESGLHGIGLKSIKASIQKYNGQRDIDLENGVFTLSIILSI